MVHSITLCLKIFRGAMFGAGDNSAGSDSKEQVGDDDYDDDDRSNSKHQAGIRKCEDV